MGNFFEKITSSAIVELLNGEGDGVFLPIVGEIVWGYSARF